jgi:hypothetical protein
MKIEIAGLAPTIKDEEVVRMFHLVLWSVTKRRLLRKLGVGAGARRTANGLRNGLCGVDSRDGSKNAACGDGRGVGRDGTIDPFWTAYSETSDFGAGWRGGAGGVRAVADLVHGCGDCKRDDRRAVGHFVAHVDREGYVLDAGAHPDSIDGRACGNRLRLHDFDSDVWARYGDARGVGEDLGLSRAAGSVHSGVGMHRDADVGAVRQLVAQRVWVGRKDFESASYVAVAGFTGDQDWIDGSDGGLDEPRDGECAQDARVSLALYRGELRRADGNDPDDQHLAERNAPGGVLSSRGDCDSSGADCAGVGIAVEVGMHSGRWELYDHLADF